MLLHSIEESAVLTIGQRNLFFPEIKSHSKSREINHSYLRISQLDEERKTGENAHINTCKRMDEFYPALSVLFNLIGEFPVRHWDKAKGKRQRISGDGEDNSEKGVVFGWSICPMFRLRNVDSSRDEEKPSLHSSPIQSLLHPQWCTQFN